MLPLKAHVRNGHVVLDEPVTLPEGTALEITVLERAPAPSGGVPMASARDPGGPRCDQCGLPVTPGFPCDVCAGVDNNFPGKHD